MIYYRSRIAGILIPALLITCILFISAPGCSRTTGIDTNNLQHTFPSPGTSVLSPSPPALPVKDPAGGEVMAKLFYANSQKDPEEQNPDVTYPIEVSIKAENEDELVRKMIDRLVKGPEGSYKDQGYYTSLPSDTKINSVKIEGETLSIDFNDSINMGGGSCMMEQRRSQIENTLLNIPGKGIKKVIISVNGDSQDVMQP